ncbi:MAG TPA: leucyl aminopeptidase family protein [Phycisphaerales bacterium]|nr:leucyl aminopeptidase family protein [Phycisphaerales bacterium]
MFQSIRVAAISNPNVLVVGHFQNEAPDKATLALDPTGALEAASKRTEATGETGRMVEAFPASASNTRRGARNAARFPKRIILIGLGERAKFDPSKLRDTIAPVVARRVNVTKDESILFDFTGPLAATKTDANRAGVCLGEGLGLIAWTADEFKGSAAPLPKRLKLTIAGKAGSGGAFQDGMEHGLGLARSANVARSISHAPPNVCTPDWIADRARKLARETGLKCRVFSGPDLVRERFEGLINVGKASENKPCMIRLEWTPKGGSKKNAKPIVIIGKTMTYDSGGLSLKINNGMRGMKRDKDGGCAVFGAMHAIATVIKPRRPVVALLASAENSINEAAYRPDDVIKFRNGVTVEVTNTDAEGRLVLADALCWACEKEDPAYIVDLATLTGGVVTALGSTFAGMWCDDDRLRAKIEAASARSGERVWRLPHHQEYRDMMKSDVADLINSNPNRKAHPIQGAAFLAFFVTAGIPWCHLDIAGVHAVEGDTGPFVKNSATGFGTRLLAELIDAE